MNPTGLHASEPSAHPPTEMAYPGSELSLFAEAVNWKDYLYQQISPFLGDRVLEAGAGIGGSTRALCRRRHAQWLCLEPDPTLAAALKVELSRRADLKLCEAVIGTITTLPKGRQFDSILYIDVLEHIQDDAAELNHVAEHLRPGGYLVILAPAHQWLYSPFDQSIGHIRRYSKRTLSRQAPRCVTRKKLVYLDAVGLLASIANRFLLHQSMPTPGQIRLWDRTMVPVSRVLDRLIRGALGKSILGVWQK